MAIKKEPKPVAVAEIKLSEKERHRIAKDLGLERDEIDAVPEVLHIKRYATKDLARQDPGAFAAEQVGFGKIPDGILIPV
jgi:hypothetical protein